MSKQPLIENLEYIDGTKEEIRDVLESKGIEVSDEDTFRSYADKLEELSSEDSLEEFKEVIPKTVTQIISPTDGYKAIKQISVSAVSSDIDENIKAENIKKGVEILGVAGEYEVKLQNEVTVIPSTEYQAIAPEEEYDGIYRVAVEPVTSDIDKDITPQNIKKGINILGIEGELESHSLQENLDIRPSKEMQFLTPDEGYDGVKNLTVYPITRLIDENIQPYNIKKDVEIMGVIGTVEQLELEEYKVVSPTSYHQTITPGENYNGLKRVEVLAANKDVDSNIKPENIKEGATILGVTGTYDGVEDLELQYVTVSPTCEAKGIDVTYSSNYDALGGVHVNPITASMVKGLSPEIIKRGEKVLEMTGTYGETSQVKTVRPSTNQQSVRPDEGIKFLESVTVLGVDRSIDSDIQASNIKKGIEILGVEGTYEGDFRFQNKTASLNTEEPVTYTADAGYNALASVTVPRVTYAIDGNIQADNIKKGINILGVMGTYEPSPAQTEKYISPSTYEKLVYPDTGYSSMNRVRIGAVTSGIDSNIKPDNIRKGKTILGVLGTAEATIPQIITVNPSTESQVITPEEDYNCITRVNVKPVTSSIDENITPTNIKNGINILGVTGTYDGASALQQKIITPKDEDITVTADAAYDALSVVTVTPPETEDIEVDPSLEEIIVTKKKDKFINSVTINPVSSDVDKNIQPENIRKNMSILGVVGSYEGEDPEDPFITNISSGGYSSSYWHDSHDTNVSNSHYMPGVVKNVLRIPGTLAVSGESLQSAFEGMTSLVEAPSVDFSGVTTASRMFLNCTSLSIENFPKYNSSSCQNWYYTFCKCTSLTRVPEHDYSGATSTGKMFCDSGIVEVPSNFMELFPKVTDISAMFFGCPLSGELNLTLGSEYHRDNNIKLTASDFVGCSAYNTVKLKIASELSFSGSISNGYASSYKCGLPNGKIDTIVEYIDGGYITYLSGYVPVHTSDTVCRINSERNHDFNLIGCTNASYFFATGNASTYREDIYVNLPDTTSFSNCFYDLYNFVGDIYLHVGPNCTSISGAFYKCNALKKILPYTEGKPVIDGSKIVTVGSSAFKNAKNLTDFEGITDLGKAYTSKSANNSSYKLDLSTCVNLSVESLRSIILRLYDLNISYKVAEGGTLYRQQLILGATNLAKLTADEIAIATNKGWNVS